MPKKPCQMHLKSVLITLVVLTFASFVLAQEQSPVYNQGVITSKDVPETKKGTVIIKEGQARDTLKALTWQEEKNLSSLQKEARAYRAQGLQFQNTGDLDSAMNFYQKAVILDPAYAVAFNDLGVIYEAKGQPTAAKEMYLKAININPSYTSAYTNAAILFENERDFKKAADYWKKRVDLGAIDDPWTQKARKRLEDIRLVSSERPVGDETEEEVVGLVMDISAEKKALKVDDKLQAQEYLNKAKEKSQQSDDVSALKLAIDASQLDPANTEIKDFVDKIQKRLLSK